MALRTGTVIYLLLLLLFPLLHKGRRKIAAVGPVSAAVKGPPVFSAIFLHHRVPRMGTLANWVRELHVVPPPAVLIVLAACARVGRIQAPA